MKIHLNAHQYLFLTIYVVSSAFKFLQLARFVPYYIVDQSGILLGYKKMVERNFNRLPK
jgi:hypothetical protein